MRHFFSSPRCNVFLAVAVFFLFLSLCSPTCFSVKPYRFFRLFSGESLSLLTHPGGVVIYASLFLRQFYCNPYIAFGIAAGIFYVTAEGLAILSRRRWPLVSVAGGLLAVVLETFPEYPTEYTLSTLAAIWLTVVYLRSGRVWESRLPRPWNILQHFFRAVLYLALFLWLVGYGSLSHQAFYVSTLSVFYDNALIVPKASHLLPVFYLTALSFALSQHWKVWDTVDDWLARGRRWRGFSLRRLVIDVLQILIAFVLGLVFHTQIHLAAMPI